MMNDRLRERIDYYSELTTGFIVEYINGKDMEGKLREAMLYSLSGGKHLRPALLMGSFNVFTNDSFDKAIPFAAAIEMIHTYSLIHDDLPAMDDDSIRRGRPSNHVRFGEAMAILAGDALLNCAVECMLEDINEGDSNELDAVRIIMRAAGSGGMIGGQSLDLEGVSSESEFRRMYSMKTGALLRAAALSGATLGGCNSSDKKHVVEFAEKAGFAFQIKDDLLDVYGNVDIIGKPTGSDEKNNKVTLGSMIGKRKAEELLKKTEIDALKALGKINEDTWFLEELMGYIIKRKG